MVPNSSKNSAESLQQTFRELVDQAASSRHRRCLVLAGERAWCLREIQSLRPQFRSDPLWVGPPSAAPTEGFSVIAGQSARGLLGRKTHGLVVDAWDGVDPNVLGAVSGIVAGEGILIILRRPWGDDDISEQQRARLTVLPFTPDAVTTHFQTRFWSEFVSAGGVTVIDQTHGVVRRAHAPLGGPPERFYHDVARTEDQAEALMAILKVTQGRKRRPLVLLSDRGRGKSAALGFAAGEHLRDRGGRILLVAPSRAAVSPVFEHARSVWVQASWQNDALHDDRGRLELAVPSQLVDDLPEADSVFVDEAAALPIPLLRRLLDRYARVVFSTTVHGYEGTGRGFAVRFRGYLDQKTPSWRELRMETPIRWAPGCPVEAGVFAGLALASGPLPANKVKETADAHIENVEISRESLAGDSDILNQLFGTLVVAHYRTSPADLQRLLDAPNLKIFAARRDGVVLAAAWVALEGQLPTQLARDIFLGRRRPLGHLLPETLEAYSGLAGASELSAWRIVRIAVHPDAQEQGIGTRLVRTILTHARAAHVDYVGTSFGATERLLSFWREAGFKLSRLGVKRGSSSGLFSAVMLQPQSAAGTRYVELARQRFIHGALGNLSGPWSSLELDVLEAVLKDCAGGSPAPIADADLIDVAGFALGARPFEVVFDAVQRFVRAVADDLGALGSVPTPERWVLIRSLLQGHRWPDVAREFKLNGRVEVQKSLRAAVHAALMSDPQPAVKQALAYFQKP